jgi:hypothetical protein
MDFSNISSYIELVTGLNLAYAGSSNFREGLEEYLLKSKLKTREFRAQIDSFEINITNSNLNTILTNQVEIVKSSLEENYNNYIEDTNSKSLFDELFKYLFLYNGLFGLIYLMQLGCHTISNPSNCFFITICTVSFLLFFIYILVFVYSLCSQEERQENYLSSIKLGWKIGFFMIALFIALLNGFYLNWYFKCNSIKTITYINIIALPLMSFILYYIKIIIRQNKLNKKYNSKFDVLKSRFEILQGSHSLLQDFEISTP